MFYAVISGYEKGENISFFCLIISGAANLRAQGTIDAIVFPSVGHLVVGYSFGGVGWSFIPTADMMVTGVEASAPQMNFWAGTNQVIGTFSVTNPNARPANSFEPIIPLLLLAGQLYYVSCQNPDISTYVSITGWASPLNGAAPPFVVSPYFTQYASYSLTTSGQWTAPNITIPNTEALLYGPNFQFQLVPEPSSIGLGLLGITFFACLKKRQRW